MLALNSNIETRLSIRTYFQKSSNEDDTAMNPVGLNLDKARVQKVLTFQTLDLDNGFFKDKID